jgi:excisionase family DNA binding protein
MQFYTVAEVSSRLRISPSAVYELIHKGTLPCHRVGPRGGAIRVSDDDLEAYVHGCRRGTEPLKQVTVRRTVLKHLRA